jgi:hypothetical protein
VTTRDLQPQHNHEDTTLYDPGHCPACGEIRRQVEDRAEEAEILLSMNGREERLDRVVADLRSGKIQPVDHAVARARIEKL